MPLPLKAIQVDGGSEFMAGFEATCKERGVALRVLPPGSRRLNGHVERGNGTWRYEFYNVWELDDDIENINRCIDAFADEFNHYRPHQALGLKTPAEYLQNHMAKEAP